MPGPIDRSYERLVNEGRVGIRYRSGTTQVRTWSAGEGDPPYKKETLVSDQKPSVGRIVHYSEDGATCLAAIVAAVNDNGTVNLAYTSEVGGFRQAQNVGQTENGSPYASEWHWPERA